MKILIVGGDKIYSIENHYVKYLREAGVEVELYPAQSIFYDYYLPSILHKILFKTGISRILQFINKELKKKVEAFKPDVVWVFKGMELFPETIKWIKAQNVFVANYNPDNPFIFTDKGSGNANVTNSIDLYDLHFTYNLDTKTRLEQRGLKTAFLPFGYEIPQDLFDRCQQQEEIVKACFLGNPDPQRGAFIMALAPHVPIDVYGNSWEKFVNHENITINKPVYGDELWMVLRRYRAQINVMRIHNEDSHNMRSFEVPGIAGIMAAPATTEHKLFFEDGKEALLYTDAADCVEKIRKLIALPKSEADQMRLNARATSEQKGYDYKSRTLHALEILKEQTGIS